MFKFALDDRKVLITDLWGFENCHLRDEAKELGKTARKVVNLSGREVGWIRYDVADTQDLSLDRSAVIGRLKARKVGPRQFHILILRRRGEDRYERAGAGMVQEGYILRQRSSVRIY